MKRATPVIVLLVVVALAASVGRAWLAEVVDVSPPATDLSDMVFVPAGSFVVRGRRHVLDAYWIDRFEVTEADWARDAAGIAEPPYGEGEPHGEDFPVRYVTHREAVRYAERHFKRLPTNLEWERACQGPQGQPLPWGSGYLAVANTLEAWSSRRFDGWGVTRVGTFENGRSGVGAYDMIGNVREWTADDHRALLHYKPTAEETRLWDAGLELGEISYVIRGASFATRISGIGAAPEQVELGGTRIHDLGFRCVISKAELDLQGEVLELIRDLGYRDFWNRRTRVEPARERLFEIGPPALPYLAKAREAAGDRPWLRDRIVAIMDSVNPPTP